MKMSKTENKSYRCECFSFLDSWKYISKVSDNNPQPGVYLACWLPCLFVWFGVKALTKIIAYIPSSSLLEIYRIINCARPFH